MKVYNKNNVIINRNLYRVVSMKIFNCALLKKSLKMGNKAYIYNAKNSSLKALLNKKVLLSLFLNRFSLEIDLFVDGRGFQSLGAA